tara:strand:- start:38 stop:841 length:804 start_codon:yes stop_codon:yes gene_type:complete
MAIYNTIGSNYNKNRSADYRITNQLKSLIDLPKNSKIADIGAGTGNYTNELASLGFSVDAIEPSSKMIDQATKLDNVKWIQSSVEQMELNENYYDCILSILSIHHFSSITTALSKIKNSLKENGSLIVFGADPRKIDTDCWFKDYFGEMIEKAKDSYTELSELISKIESTFHNKVEYYPFSIPHDITDGFFYAGWQKPEKYLDENFRNSISVFAKAPKNLLNKATKKLTEDLQSGKWDEKHGKIRTLKKYNGGYYFLRIKNTPHNNR